MTRVKCIAVLLMGFFAGCCSGDVVVEAKQATQQLDSAIKASEDAWVNGAAQTQVLKTILTFADPKAQATQDAQALETSYESQLATYNATLNDLQADRAIMVNVLTTYQQAMLQKINNYKTAYVGQMGSINAQIKLVQDVIITIQNLLADSPMTDAKVRTISDAQGKAQGALSGIGDALHSLISLDTKIDSDMAGFQLQDATQAKVFSDWWAEQKAWVKQTQAAVDARIQYLSQLGAQMEQKQKDFNAQQGVQKQLDAAAVDLQQKKTEALDLFQQLVQVRATLIQDMSDLANTIASTLGSADQSLASAIQDAELAKVLDAAQSITDNMMAMGRLQGSFTSSEDVIAQALDSLKAFYSDQELVSLRSSITQQTSWVKNFSSALQAMRDQSAAIRTKLDLKRTQLATATSSSANQSAADYAASVQQVTQVIVQVHNEAAALIKDVMTPLVLAISQNMMGLMGYFDVQTTKSSDLMGMKNLIDEISSDTAEMDTLLNEFNLWEATFNKYGDLIQQQVSDATLRQTLSAIKQDFASWLPWITAVSGRQVKMKESIASAQAKYNVLESQLNASKATTSVVPVVQPSVEPAANSAVAPAAASSAATTGSSATLTVATTAASKNTLEVAAATQASSVVQVNSSLPATSDVAAAALTTSLSLATSPIVVTAGATIGTTVSGDSAEVAANGLLGAPAVAVLVENVKKVTDSVAALKPIVSGFKARLDGTKITDDFTKLNADFTSAQGNVEPLNAMIKQCLSAADAAQKLIDQDTAAGRNVASDVIQSLADQRIALVAAQQDIDGVAKALSEVTAAFNALAANFAEKTKALAKVSAAATDLANKIQTLSGDLNTIKQAIKDAQSALTTAKSGVDCDVALARLKTAQDLEVTIKNAKANEVMPAKKALSDQVVSFAQTYGALPDALSASITNKGTWLDALDATLSGYISSATSLQEKLTDLRDSLAQSDMKSLVGMTFAAQLQVLENAVRSLSQKAQVDPIMRMLDYAVTNRYGKLSVDMNRDIKAANRVKLLQIIEWIKKNNFFASKVNLLKEYSKTITQDRID